VTDAAAPLALLAGASRGLGLALAHELGSRGYRLAICSRDESELDRAAETFGAAAIRSIPRWSTSPTATA
jgi:short-subunit dehydrogenase